MNKVIVIYEQIPDNTLIYMLHVNDEDLEKIKSCHGLFINIDNWEHLEWLYDFLKKHGDKVYDGAKPYNKIIENVEPITLVISGYAS